jgi:hypothetical protein
MMQQGIKNLDKVEREKLFNELNDAASHIQHKLYQEESKKEEQSASFSEKKSIE